MKHNNVNLETHQTIFNHLRGVFEKQQDWVYKCFILFDTYILQHVAFKVISLGSNALFQFSLHRFHALLKEFLRNRLELSRHGCFNGF